MGSFNKGGSIRIESDNRQSSLTMTIVDTETYYPSAQIAIEIDDDGFQGRDRSVWVTDTDLLAFIRDLAALDLARKGECTLVSMSPGEFELVLKYPNATQLLLTYCLRKASHIASNSPCVHHSVTGGFLLDPSRLPQYLSDFQAMLQATG